MDREETFLTGRGRHPTESKVAMAFDKEGKLLALDSDVIIDGGAYGSFGVVSAYYNGVLSNGPYRIPAFRYHGKRVYSNRIPSGAMRGHGSVNPRYCTETLVEMAPWSWVSTRAELRLRNFLESNTSPFHKFRITSNGIREGLAEAMKRSDWKQVWQAALRPRHRRRLRVVHQRQRVADSLEQAAAKHRPPEDRHGWRHHGAQPCGRHRTGQ
ncbi:MAG: molybdopterin cofactor-binding domain-containing protein [Planctomycetota bacterium]